MPLTIKFYAKSMPIIKSLLNFPGFLSIQISLFAKSVRDEVPLCWIKYHESLMLPIMGESGSA